jgi:hypothetical protein
LIEKHGITVDPSDEERFAQQMYQLYQQCGVDQACTAEMQMLHAAVVAAQQYPEALEEENIPGQYRYFEAYSGCPGASRVQLELDIEGERYNKSAKKIVAFKEHREADTVNPDEGKPLCMFFTAVIDTKAEEKSFYLENVHVPRPFGETTFTERGHTERKTESQPMPPAVLDWMTATLRHAEPSGTVEATLPLYMSLNGNSTWLGIWKGEARVTMDWSFDEVPARR